MKTKYSLSFSKLWDLIQEKPERSALIVSIIITVPMFVLMALSFQLPKEISFDTVAKIIFDFVFMVSLFACIGGLFWFGFVMIFGEKKRKELSERALKSGLEVMINQALIENGSITKPEQMVKL